MLKNIVKITLIILMIAPISAAYVAKQQDTYNVSMRNDVSTMILAKGQYINDSRNYKPGIDCCIC